MDVLHPARADQRMVLKMIDLSLPSKVDAHPSAVDLITRVFCRAGGSWVRLFNGAPSDLALLKRVIKVAFAKGHLEKAQKWG